VDAMDLDADPLRQLAAWLDAARAAGAPMPEAMTIASATSALANAARSSPRPPAGPVPGVFGPRRLQ